MRTKEEERKLVAAELARGEDPFKRLARESDARVVARGGTSIFALKPKSVAHDSGNSKSARFGIRHKQEKYHP